MSYLVDALKKAERERHAEQAGHWQAATQAETGARRGGGLWPWVLALLLASNAALLVYIWRPQPETPPPARQPASASSSAAVESNSAPAASDNSPPTIVRQPVPAPAPSPATTRPASPTPTPGNTARAAAPDAENAGASSTSEAPASAAPGSGASANAGQVTYSRVPLTADESGPPAARTAPAPSNTNSDTATPWADAGSNAPRIEINGQLYSTVPGRSFILVNGRRYHEGERLAAGPAVEQIEPSGAILRYRGARYHVPGPN